MRTFVILNKGFIYRVKTMLYGMLCYAMVWYDEWESMRLHAIVWDSYAMVWDSNAIIWNFNVMLCYAIVYVVTDMLELTIIII